MFKIVDGDEIRTMGCEPVTNKMLYDYSDPIKNNSSVLMDWNKLIPSQSDSLFGQDRSKDLERLEEELVSEKRKTCYANEQCEIEKKERINIQKKI